MKHITLVCLLLYFAFGKIHAQSKPQIIPEIEDLLSKENYDRADKLVKQRIDSFLKNKNADTLLYYVVYLGKTSDKLKGNPKAKEELLSFLTRTKTAFPYHKTLIQLHIKAAHFISTSGDHKWAYQLTEGLDKYFSNHQSGIRTDLPKIYFALGDFSIRMGNPGQASAHYKHSMQLLKDIPNPDAEQMFVAYNSMGIVKHFEPDPDSALYYWKKALGIIPKMEQTPLNKYARKSSIENNLGNAYSSLGKQKEALKMYEASFKDGKAFLDSPEPNPQKSQSNIYQLYTLDNIAKIYLDLGDLTKAYDIYYYSYQLKLKIFGETNNEIDKAVIFLATVLNYQHKYDKALSYSLDALRRIKKSGDTATSWEANAYNQAAAAYRSLGNISSATKHYEEAHRIHKIIDREQIDQYYLNFTQGLINFYAETGQFDKAISIAKQGISHLEKAKEGKETYVMSSFRSLAQTYYLAKDYKSALKTSNQGVGVANALLRKSNDLLDSISVETEKSKLLLVQTKSKYQLLTKKDTTSIKSLLVSLEEASKIIEHRKSILSEQTDINVLIANSKELTDFIKHLNYELYKLSDNKSYIDKIIGVHEAALYSRIRSRMDRQKAIRFASLPDSIVAREAMLKEQLETALQQDGSNDKVLTYLQAVKNREVFLQQLKTQYPRYYKMRYGTSEVSLEELCGFIPAGVSVVRYIFSNEELLAVVASKEKQVLVPLSSENLTEKIVALNEAASDPVQTGQLASALYGQLWQPLENHIAHDRVIIIPDDALYNLSFDMLTPVTTKDFAALSKNCLLNKYAVSYQYSLPALSAEKRNTPLKANFVAFAPGFSEKNKKQYLLFAKNDSLHLDKQYLSLLPLPFTANLVKRIKEKLGGKLFAESASTPEVFRKQAGNHHIIHIGTHAESNNDYPEYSRLIFAKDDKNINAENSVYLYDIYDCNLTSDLAVLTACESGKPGYQDGEGMVSMAHAFNYAGSESIMTGLWKIDEQSSMQITEAFYENIQKGMTKDEALRQAKLHYLKNANGRMSAPQYWAGLVIMGDVSAVELQTNIIPKLIYFLGSAAVLIIIGYYFFRKKKSVTVE